MLEHIQSLYWQTLRCTENRPQGPSIRLVCVLILTMQQ